MGEVFLADDTRLHRPVALKAVTDSGAPDAAQRIIAEARAAARLNHPNIATVHDIVEQDGRTYIVMEYVDGTPLSEELRRGPMRIERIVEIGAEIAGALAYAHERGVLHRDVKPANVMLTADGHAKLLDLGIARLVATGGKAATTSATMAPRAGTAAYMSPERILGAEPSALDDVYSLGVLLFELTTGRRPFEGTDALQVSVAIATDQPPEVMALRPDAPEPLASVIKRAMARDRKRRPAAGEMATALHELASGSAPTSAAPRAGRGRRTALWGSLAVAIVALAGMTAVWMTAARTPRYGRGPVAVLPAVNLSNDAVAEQIGNGLVTLLAGNLTSVPGVTVAPPSASAAYRGPARDLSKAAQELGAAFLVAVDVQRDGEHLRLNGKLLHAGTPEPLWAATFAGDVLAVHRELIQGVADALEREGLFPKRLSRAERAAMLRLPTNDVAALLAYSRGRASLDVRTKETIDSAIAEFEDATRRDPRFGLAQAALSDSYATKFNFTKDAVWIERARQAAERALSAEPRSSSVHIALARVYTATGEFEAALTQAQVAAQLSPESDDAYRLLGRIRSQRGDHAGAREALARAIALREPYWANHYELGFALFRAGSYKEAIKPFARVTELRPNLASGYQMLGTMHHYAGEVDKAIGHYQHALRLGESASAYANLGFAYYSAGEPAQSLAHYQKSLQLDPRSASTLRSLGDVYAKLGRRPEARDAYTRAIAEGEERARINPRDGRTIALIALCEAKLGRLDAALRHAAEAEALAPSDNEIAYKGAVVRGLAARQDEALASLTLAVALGYPPELARQDEDLRALRNRSDYSKALQHQ